ncbi:MAG: PD-(D/E)XK nuclease family protein [Robiginitalea sp.]
MQSFLESVLHDFTSWKTNPEDCIFILPSKRAGFFLKNLMARKAGNTLLAPRILSIENFVEQLSGLRYATPTKLLFSLYEAYLDQDGIEKESFFDFSKWGQMLLQDFNEIDRYLVETDEFFRFLSSIQEIKQWTLDGSSTPMIDKRVRFWKSLKPLYHRFRKNLEAEGLGYQGQVYRRAVERLSGYLHEHQGITHIFLGFNALNRSEEEIIQKILKEGNAQIYWDADPHYLDNPVHDAGLFIRKHKNSWESLQDASLKGISKHLTSAKTISITGLPKSVSQSKFCGTLVESILEQKNGDLSNTALILGEESLLNPVLHALPGNLKGVNITMGYPMKDTPTAHLFGILFEMFLGHGSKGFPLKEVLKVLSHPFLQNWFGDTGFDSGEASRTLIRENTFYVTYEDLEKFRLPGALQPLFSLNATTSPGDVIQRCLSLIERLRPFYQKKGSSLSLEYLHHFHLLFNQLDDLCREYPFINSLKSLRMLFDQLLQEDRIDFQGEPLEGLQIMGMLESRNLDFETVIITSVNEGILPSGKSNNSFIPFDVKKAFGLPTYKEKDAVYTYHFYRLLQRAKQIYITYNTEPDVLEGGEPSRFVRQLQNDPVLSSYVRHSLAAPKVGTLPKETPEIIKSTALLNMLRAKAVAGFSPTALSQYIADPMVFYRKNLLGIRESDELEETIAANTFGTVIHESLEALYRPLVGEILTKEHIAHLKNNAPRELHNAFKEHYLKGTTASGKNLIALRVMGKYLDMFLEMETLRIHRHEVRILGVEEKMDRKLNDVPGLEFPVLLKGTVDRIEEVDGQLQIIDYKTGRVEPGDLRIGNWEDLHTDPAKSKAFQVLCYSWLIQGQDIYPSSGFKAGVFSFKKIASGVQWYGRQVEKRKYDEFITEEVLDQFRGTLQALTETIFNPEVPITEPVLN